MHYCKFAFLLFLPATNPCQATSVRGMTTLQTIARTPSFKSIWWRCENPWSANRMHLFDTTYLGVSNQFRDEISVELNLNRDTLISWGYPRSLYWQPNKQWNWVAVLLMSSAIPQATQFMACMHIPVYVCRSTCLNALDTHTIYNTFCVYDMLMCIFVCTSFAQHFMPRCESNTVRYW